MGNWSVVIGNILLAAASLLLIGCKIFCLLMTLEIWGKLKFLTRNILSQLEIFWNSFQFTDSSCVWTKPFRIVLHHFCVLCVAFCITRTRPKGHFLQNQVQKDQANDMFAYNSIPVNISPCNNSFCRCVKMLLHLKMSNITNCYGNLHNSWSRKKVKEIVWESIGHNCMRHYYCMLIVVVIMREAAREMPRLISS